MMRKAYVLYLLAVLIASIAQVFLKYAVLQHYSRCWEKYFNLYVLGAYGLFCCSSLMTIWAYRELPLSTGAILDVTGYLYITLFGRFFFGECVTGKKILGLGLIMGGICIHALFG